AREGAGEVDRRCAGAGRAGARRADRPAGPGAAAEPAGQARPLMGWILPRARARARCRAWRPAPRPDGHPIGHEPGACRIGWLLLAAHPAGEIRSSVAARRDVPLDVLQDLADDPHAPVAYRARDQLEEIAAHTRPHHGPIGGVRADG